MGNATRLGDRGNGACKEPSRLAQRAELYGSGKEVISFERHAGRWRNRMMRSVHQIKCLNSGSEYFPGWAIRSRTAQLKKCLLYEMREIISI